MFCKVGLKLPAITAAISAVIASVKHVYVSLHIILSNFGFCKVGLKLPVITAVITAAIAAVIAVVKYA